MKSRALVLAILLFLVLGAGSRCVIHSHDDDDTPPQQQQKAPWVILNSAHRQPRPVSASTLRRAFGGRDQGEGNLRSATALAKLERASARSSSVDRLRRPCASQTRRRWRRRLPTTWLTELREDEQRLFGRYGFDGEEDGDAEWFLQVYLDVMKKCAERVGGTYRQLL
jgi:hypothetical protein